ncbi:MAG: UDP-N-acetylglucosamine 2-epimerase [Parcubacteria group bacterium]|nr:UDP-N-acetylglucosamine 2-epimerase [Parcubacteria group bacterium]
MGDKRLVCVATGGRAERFLTQPIIRRLTNHPRLSCTVLPVGAEDQPWETARYAHEVLGKMKPDVVLVSCDRREQVPVAMEAFYMNLPVFHFLGGSFSYTLTHDDVNRHVLSFYSSIIYCESEKAKQNLVDMGFEEWRLVVTGSSHFDDVKIDESLCPEEPYDLVLMNPVPLSRDRTRLDAFNALTEVWRRCVIIGPNEDPLRELIVQQTKNFIANDVSRSRVDYYERGLPRPQFLGLLKNCRRFISNSSATVFEAEYLGVKTTVNPSQRNKRGDRDTPPANMLKGGADKVVKHLAEVDLENPLLLAKRIGRNENI